MTARILDGRAIAGAIEAEVTTRVARLAGGPPCLAVVLIGATEPARAYRRGIQAAAERCGVTLRSLELSEESSPSEAFARIADLNQDRSVHGILLKRPLPGPLGDEELLQALDPAKDVDGCHFQNLGRLVVWGARAGHVPCTPAGVLEILRRSEIRTRGMHAVILGRSVTVGRPLASLLLQKDAWADATVTLCHSSTRALAEHTRRADLLVAALGVPRFVTADMVRPGAVVVDVGTNSLPDPTRKSGFRLVGDVDLESVRKVASAITPVPGGVGPVTTAMLLHNLLDAAEAQAGLTNSSGRI